MCGMESLSLAHSGNRHIPFKLISCGACGVLIPFSTLEDIFNPKI